MTKATKNRLLDLAKTDLSDAQDNLRRSMQCAVPLDAQFGESDTTLRRIREGYQKWEASAASVVAELEAEA